MRPPQNNKNIPDVTNVFLRKLAKLIVTSQRRERAWHARLMICTTIHSSIESSFSNFSNENNKEEAEAFKDHIQLAIAKLMTIDSCPSPQIPTHNRPTKEDKLKKTELL